MDEFTQRVHNIDAEQLRVFLNSLRSPCYESELMRVAFPDFEIGTARPLSLYQNHFLLFHVLYQLQEEFARQEKYLFIHFMRTMLLPYPPTGTCRFFDERLVLFCEAPCAEGKEYCAFHLEQLGETAIDELSLRYFYADPRNFYTLDEETAEAFLNGTWEILTHYTAYQESFRVLGLSETSDIAQIKKTFKRLARQYHPDRGAESHEHFTEINNAYQFLMRVIPRFPSKA